MIRFSCPGCDATYTVEDAKGGKSGKCPKCQARFVIPLPEGGVPPPPPPAVDPNAAVEIAPCPGCKARLSVSAADLGIDVECPYCKTVYKAERAGAAAGSAGRRALTEDEEGRPSRRGRGDEVEDEARPSRRRRDEEDEEDEDRPRRRRDEDEDDRPRKRRRRRRAGGAMEPHRGTQILVFGILSLLCCWLIFGPLAISQANEDLAKMEEGSMDPEGESMTKIGKILGIVGIVLGVLGAVANIAVMLMG